jgi:hypothetical protein
VAIDWALDVLFTKDFVQFLDQRALVHTQTETGAALWNREHLSVAGGVNAGKGAAAAAAAKQPGSTPPGYSRSVRNFRLRQRYTP